MQYLLYARGIFVYKNILHCVTNVIKIILTFVLREFTIMNRRLQYLLELEGLTQAQFAERIGVGRASISHILNGRNNPGYDIISRILKKFPSISPDWLILGQGKPYRDKTAESPTLFYNDESAVQEEVTDDLPSFLPSENQAEQRKQAAVQRKIKRVTVYYDDNTFEEFTK